MNTLILTLFAATIPLRNPFWPVGYNGHREIITDQPRVEIKVTTDDEEKKDSETSVNAETIAAARAEAEAEAARGDDLERLWVAARKTLKFGGTMKLAGERPRQAIAINGKIYSDGDLVSINHDNRRFTWRIKALTEGGTIKLERIRQRELDDDSAADEETKQ